MSVDLEVPIEMLDTGCSSSSATATTFNHSKTRIQQYISPFAFDGTLTTTWEIIVSNSNVDNAYDVNLLDDTATLRATISVPANTPITRRSVTFTLANTGFQLQTPVTAVSGDIKVYSSRIRIAQAGATRTDVSIPMLNNIATNLGSGNPTTVDDVLSATYTQDFPDKYSIWTRDDAKWATYRADGDPSPDDRSHALEVNLHRSGGSGSAFAKLINVTDSTEVTGSEVSTTSTIITQLMAQFNSSATNFHDGDDYEVMIKGSSDSVSLISQARLRVRLTSLDKAEVYYRFHRSGTTVYFATATFEYSRILVDTSLFDTPLVYHESTGRDHPSFTPKNFKVELYDHNANDAGLGGSLVSGSGFTWANGTKDNKRTNAITIDSGDRFLMHLEETEAGVLYVTSSWLVVHCETAVAPPSVGRRRAAQVI